MSEHKRPPAPTSATDESRHLLDQLADSFVARLRRGEHPSIETYADRFPHLADEIRDVLSTLLLLEDNAGAYGAEHGQSTQSRPGPETLGEYRILREIGRGGMGVVFEAEHQTMRRRVALKVLSLGLAPDDQRLKRFYLEASLAGRLHHTNIVPVFEVGTDQGYHYYAMQFIQGQNLDVVISELRQLRNVESTKQTSTNAGVDTTLTHSEARCIGWVLHSGAYRTAMTDDAPATNQSQSALTHVDPQDSAYDQTAYFQRLSHIGLQIVEALQYAHSHGVIHRDIKPANIILDSSGVAWVTDFGLAKKAHDDLTRSGDVVGTIRYMAPERFQGKADSRSDIYGVGVTLYELCTLQPAFQSSDRVQLIDQICNSAPRKPRQINPQIPLDLETIILKAMDQIPDRRYATAGELATDLKLLLEDRPIRARRVSASERVWRWCRRNPLQATLASCVFLLLVIVTVGSLAFGYASSMHARQLAASQQRATERLYESLQRSAEAARWSRRPGQSFVGVQELAHAAQVLPQLGWSEERQQHELVKLRDAAIAALALPDVEPQKAWPLVEPWTENFAFTADHSMFAIANNRGAIVIRSVKDDQELHRLVPPEQIQSVIRLAFGPRSKYLAVLYASDQGNQFAYWDVSSGRVFMIPGVVDASASFLFASQGDRLFLLNRNQLAIQDLNSGDQLQELRFPGYVEAMGLSASGEKLAIALAGPPRLQILETDKFTTGMELTAPQALSAIAWHPNGRQLVLGTQDGTLQVHDLEPSLPVAQRFQGHSGRINRLFLANSGHHLISQSWDGTVRFWNVGTGDQVLRIDGISLLSSGVGQGDSSYMGTSSRSKLQLWKLELNPPLRVLQTPRDSSRRWSVDFDRSGRWLASARNDGVEVWDIASGELVESMASKRPTPGASKDAQFLPHSNALITSNGDGVQWVPYRDSTDGKFNLQPDAARSLYSNPASWLSVDQQGAKVAFRVGFNGTTACVVDVNDSDKRVQLGPHPGIDHVELSPDGRWVASSCWGGYGVHLWDASSGQRLTKHLLEPYATKSNAVFSPDSQWMTTSTPKYWVTWRVEDGTSLFRISRPNQDDWPGPLAYTPDGRLLVAANSRFNLALLSAQTGQHVALLDAGSNVGFHDCCVSDDGRLLAAASDTSIHLWDLDRLKVSLSSMGLDW